MKIDTIHIHNFRGIIDQTFQLGDYSLLVGANNTGKTTVMDCIRAFYEKDGYSYKSDRDSPKKGKEDGESFIEIEYCLSDEEYDSLAENYQIAPNRLKVKKSFETSEKLSDGKPAKGVIRGFTREGVYSGESFYGAKNVQNGKLGEIIYIPASNDVTEFTKFSGPSALRDLVTNILTNVLNENQSYTELTSSIENFSSKIKTIESKNNQSVNVFEEELNQMLTPWGTSFQINIEAPGLPEIIKSMTKYCFIDNNLGCEQDINNYGSGFQRHFIYSLIRIGNKYLSNPKISTKKEFSPQLSLLLFEEPEAFLHPPQQIKLAHDLKRLGEESNWQILCSTHSPSFVSRAVEDVISIIHFENNGGIVSTHQINKEQLDSLFVSNLKIMQILEKFHKLDEDLVEEDSSPEINLIKYFMSLNPDRASAFFSEIVLLVEGPSEVYLINKLLEEEIIISNNNVYVFDCLGKHNIHRFMNLFGALGINHSVLYDGDNEKNEHKEINDLIENNIKDYTLKINKFPDDLEVSLGVETIKENYKKPQHLLYLYINQEIDQEKLDNFINVIQDLISN